MSESDEKATDGETIELPADRIGESVRKQALLDCEITVLAPEGADVSKWDVLEEAEFTGAKVVRDDLHCWYETEVRISEKIARATRWQPAEYRNHDCPTHVTIVWDFNPESQPTVEIDVEHP